MKKKTTKKPVSKRVIKKPTLKKTNSSSNNPNITKNLKQQVFAIIINDLISALHAAKVGQSIRLGKLGRIKKTLRQGTINGHAYKVNHYSFKAYSTLKNN